MPFDGSGNFTRSMNWTSDATAGIKILASRHDTEDNNFASGLSNAICKDGQSSPTADIGFNGKKIINLAAPVNPTDGATKQYVDGVRNFSSAISITGSTPESRLKYTGATGPWGDSYVTPDISFGASGAAGAATWVWNDKADFTGNTVMGLSENGTLATYSVDAGALAGPILVLDRASPSPAPGDAIGAIYFRGRDSINAGTDYAFINASISDPTDTTEDGFLSIGLTVAGTPTTRITLTPTGTNFTGPPTHDGTPIFSGSNSGYYVGGGANYQRLATGYLHNYGTGTTPVSGDLYVAYAAAFATATVSATATCLIPAGVGGGVSYVAHIAGPTNAGFYIQARAISSGGTVTAVQIQVYWTALGY